MTSTRKRAVWIAAIVFAPIFARMPARAESAGPAPTASARQEAAERFDRGVRLFNQGENAGALVEFKRAYDLTGDPLLLFNIGLVFAEQKRPVDAVDALDRLLASHARLSAEQRAKAERVRAEQKSSIAYLDIDTSVPAVIDVDGVEVAHTPLGGRLPVAAGSHEVGAVAAGYPPSRRTIDIAGGETQKLTFALVPGESTLGHVGVKSPLPGAEVWIDGAQVGRTPLASTLALAPGEHRVELRREGYRPAIETVKLDVGAAAEVTLSPELDTAALPRAGGNVQLTASEPDALVSVDGAGTVPVGPTLRVPAGPHHLLVTRAGFEPAELDVEVRAGAATPVNVALMANLETRQAYLARVHERRVWGWSVGGFGAVSLVTGVVLIVTGQSALDSANSNLTAVNALFVQHGGALCDPATSYPIQTCQSKLDDANNRVTDAKVRIDIGYAAGGVGVAGLVVGAVLLLTGDDPARYDHPAGVHAALGGFTTPGGGGMLLSGAF